VSAAGAALPTAGETRLGFVNWKMLVAVGTAVGTLVWAARRRALHPASDAGVWAAATDPIAES
jgi:hypothetical protein